MVAGDGELVNPPFLVSGGFASEGALHVSFSPQDNNFSK